MPTSGDAASFSRFVAMIRKERVPGLALPEDITDEALAMLRDVPSVMEIILGGDKLTDKGLAGMGKLTGIRTCRVFLSERLRSPWKALAKNFSFTCETDDPE